MINLAFSVFAVALVGAFLGFVSIALGITGAAQLVSFVFLVLFLVAVAGSLVSAQSRRAGIRRRKRYDYDDRLRG